MFRCTPWPWILNALLFLSLRPGRSTVVHRTRSLVVQAAQLPLQRLSYEANPQETQGNALAEPEPYNVDWDQDPSEDETGHRIFTSASEAMLYWPQSVIVRGLSIIPAVVPTGTVLYHGRTDANIPAVPDWLAFDFEHAHVFVSATSGHVLTFATKRPLRVLAFDGLSAHMARDTQQMLIYGRVVEQGAPLDPQEELCEWARKHNIDGFMRAEIHFELIICDFGTTMELVSTLRVLPSEDMIKRGKPNASKINAQLPQGRDGPSSPGFGRPPPPAGWVGSLLTDYLTEIDLAAKRHDFAPGETRARPVFSKFVTFYDPAVKSLIEGRRGRTRDHHRLLGVDKADVEMMVKQLEEVVDDEVGWEEKSSASGVDWESILRVVIQRYGERLEFLNHTLATNRAEPFTQAFKSRQQVLTILAPYFTVYDIPANVSSMESKRAWLFPVVQRCTTAHTKGLPTHLFTKQEHLLYDGVQTVMREICRRMGRMFYMSYDIETIDPEKKTEETYSAIAEAMRVEISSLMEWLDWVQVWMKCRPSCAIDEYCLPSTGPGDKPPRQPGWDYSGPLRFPVCVKRPNA